MRVVLLVPQTLQVGNPFCREVFCNDHYMHSSVDLEGRGALSLKASQAEASGLEASKLANEPAPIPSPLPAPAPAPGPARPLPSVPLPVEGFYLREG